MIPPGAGAGTLTPQPTDLGPVPEILGCNAGHHFPGGNTLDWWRYSGVNGVRMFISPSEIEPVDDLAPVGDGVSDEAGFLARRAALRANPLDPQFIKWSVFEANFANRDLHPSNHIKVDGALAELRSLGISVCAQITVGESRFPLGGPDDWPGQWELWQHCYASAFHLARHHDVRRFQMYNEPDLAGMAEADYLLRLRLASDAFQCAVADVNTRYAKSLVARVHAPVNAGNATSDYNGGLGGAAVANRRINVTGAVDPAFRAVHVYDYHQYDGSPSHYANVLADLHVLLANDLAPDPRLPTCVSEFNVHTGANFDAMEETLDSPVKYARLGAILPRVAAEGIGEMYLFKFSQTVRSGGNYPVAKNALHYVDNANAPYAVGGITQGGEVWRLFCKASRSGFRRLAVGKDSEAEVLEAQATRDPVSGARFVYCVNNTAEVQALTLDFSAWGVQAGARVMIEEVGAGCRGAIGPWTTVNSARKVSGVIGAYTVWLVSVPTVWAATEDTVAAVADATVRDGTGKDANFGGSGLLEARNDPVNSSNRTAALIKFRLPVVYRPDILLVTLAADVATGGASAQCQAHVYGIGDDAWLEGDVRWSNAPNLRDNVSAGATIARGVVEGAGASAWIQGQWVADTPVAAEKQLDVTSLVRAQTDDHVSFLIAQQPRWDVELPSLAPGDVQPGGLAIIAREGAAGGAQGPRLRLLRKLDSDGDGLGDEAEGTVFGTSPLLSDTDGDGVSDGVEVLVNGTDPKQGTPLPVAREATVRGGASASSDVDETSYVMVKHSSDLGFARKSYFQFDLPQTGVDIDGPATFWVRFTNSYPQRVRLWGLTQEYPGFAPTMTWNTAQGNDVASNAMLAAGAAAIGDPVWVDPGAATPRPPKAFSIPRLGDHVFGGRVTLVLCGEADAANNSSGLRLTPGAATLQYRALPPVPDPPFTSWRKQEFGGEWQDPERAGETMDPDGDGAVNLLEYALGGKPLDGSSRGSAPVARVEGDWIEFRFRRDPGRNDIDLTIQGTEDPAGPWKDLAVATGGATAVPSAAGVTVEEQAAGGAFDVVVREPYDPLLPARFLRLEVSLRTE